MTLLMRSRLQPYVEHYSGRAAWPIRPHTEPGMRGERKMPVGGITVAPQVSGPRNLVANFKTQRPFFLR